MESLQGTDTVVATMTWARHAAEERLLCAALSRLTSEGLPMIITDGGSSPQFVDFLKALPHTSVLQSARPDVLLQIKQSLKAACKLSCKYVLYTEPDKELFFTNGLHAFLFRAASEEQAGVILASRSEASFLTYPASQRYTESVINELSARVINQPGDYCYGPMLLRRALLLDIELPADGLGWGWRPFVIGTAHRRGYKVAHWIADLPCPVEQREDNKEELAHRMRQLSQNAAGLALSMSTGA